MIIYDSDGFPHECRAQDNKDKRITALESELAALRAKIPGPMDIMVGGVKVGEVPEYGCLQYRKNHNGELKSINCTFRTGGRDCILNWSMRSVAQIKPGPRCPAYRNDPKKIAAFQSAWSMISKLGGWK